MASAIGKLTAIAIKSAPVGKSFDGGGLFLDVRVSGSRYWRMKYRYAGKERLLSFGVYPEVSLAEARRRRDAARELLRSGSDPGAVKRAKKAAQKISAANSFESIALEWLSLQRKKLAASTLAKAEWMLVGNVIPWLGKRPVSEIEPPELLAVLRRIEARGAHETAHRTKEKCGQVFRYAIATGRASRDPSADLRGALAPFVRTSRAAVTSPEMVGELLSSIEGYEGMLTTRCALRLAPLLFVRPGELRRAEWAEFNLDEGVWRIPASKMKMGSEHLVPLAPQAIAILRELAPLTGRGRYLFPSIRTSSEPMSENTINAALRRLGYDKDVMTAHGFRAMASTRLNEMGWAPDVIERQLAHLERNKVRARCCTASCRSVSTTSSRHWASGGMRWSRSCES